MKRAIILLLDSFGIGASLDAPKYHDDGADTYGNIAIACAENKADIPGQRQGSLKLPNLTRFGLNMAHLASTGKRLPEMDYDTEIEGAYGYACETSFGKDTPSGHWELMGVPVLFDWGYFATQQPCFPEELIQALIKRGKLTGVLGNKHASGTTIIEEYGQEHMQTGKPIVYTSADSVFQIAAHEETFGLQRLYDLCDIARELVDEYNIGRVIARPFVSKSGLDESGIGEEGSFTRTANRKDLSTPPPEPTLFEYLKNAGGDVIAIGKTADIFAHQGISQTIKADGNMALFDATLEAMQSNKENNTLIFTNFVDFDSKYGHRRNVAGYAAALEAFDKRLPELEAILQKDDMVIMTADHGCDPTAPGSDHTREHIPILAFGPTTKPQFIGRCDSFADVGQTLAKHFDLAALKYGNGILN